MRFASPAEATGGLDLGGLEEAWSTSWEWSWELKFHEKCLPGWVLAAQATKVACKECQEEGKEDQGGPKDDQINTPNGRKTSQDASFGSLGGDLWGFLEEKLARSWKLQIQQKHRNTFGFSMIFMVLRTCENRDIRKF